jgi:hypothetical protein
LLYAANRDVLERAFLDALEQIKDDEPPLGVKVIAFLEAARNSVSPPQEKEGCGRRRIEPQARGPPPVRRTAHACSELLGFAVPCIQRAADVHSFTEDSGTA